MILTRESPLDWDKLRIFHAAAEAGSFTHAGEALGLSQSAVSRQVSALEQDPAAALDRMRAAQDLARAADLGRNARAGGRRGGAAGRVAARLLDRGRKLGRARPRGGAVEFRRGGALPAASRRAPRCWRGLNHPDP